MEWRNLSREMEAPRPIQEAVDKLFDDSDREVIRILSMYIKKELSNEGV